MTQITFTFSDDEVAAIEFGRDAFNRENGTTHDTPGFLRDVFMAEAVAGWQHRLSGDLRQKLSRLPVESLTPLRSGIDEAYARWREQEDARIAAEQAEAERLAAIEREAAEARAQAEREAEAQRALAERRRQLEELRASPLTAALRGITPDVLDAEEKALSDSESQAKQQ